MAPFQGSDASITNQGCGSAGRKEQWKAPPLAQPHTAINPPSLSSLQANPLVKHESADKHARNARHGPQSHQSSSPDALPRMSHRAGSQSHQPYSSDFADMLSQQPAVAHPPFPPHPRFNPSQTPQHSALDTPHGPGSQSYQHERPSSRQRPSIHCHPTPPRSPFQESPQQMGVASGPMGEHTAFGERSDLRGFEGTGGRARWGAPTSGAPTSAHVSPRATASSPASPQMRDQIGRPPGMWNHDPETLRLHRPIAQHAKHKQLQGKLPDSVDHSHGAATPSNAAVVKSEGGPQPTIPDDMGNGHEDGRVDSLRSTHFSTGHTNGHPLNHQPGSSSEVEMMHHDQIGEVGVEQAAISLSEPTQDAAAPTAVIETQGPAADQSGYPLSASSPNAATERHNPAADQIGYPLHASSLTAATASQNPAAERSEYPLRESSPNAATARKDPAADQSGYPLSAAPAAAATHFQDPAAGSSGYSLADTHPPTNRHGVPLDAVGQSALNQSAGLTTEATGEPAESAGKADESLLTLNRPQSVIKTRDFLASDAVFHPGSHPHKIATGPVHYAAQADDDRQGGRPCSIDQRNGLSETRPQLQHQRLSSPTESEAPQHESGCHPQSSGVYHQASSTHPHNGSIFKDSVAEQQNAPHSHAAHCESGWHSQDRHADPHGHPTHLLTNALPRDAEWGSKDHGIDGQISPPCHPTHSRANPAQHDSEWRSKGHEIDQQNSHPTHLLTKTIQHDSEWGLKDRSHGIGQQNSPHCHPTHSHANQHDSAWHPKGDGSRQQGHTAQPV